MNWKRPTARSSKSEDFVFKTIAESIPETPVLLYNDSGRPGQAGLCKNHARSRSAVDHTPQGGLFHESDSAKGCRCHHRIQPERRPAGQSCPPRAESLCAQGRQGAAGRSGQGRMADGTHGSGSAGPCGRRRGRDQIRACQGRNSGRKLL